MCANLIVIAWVPQNKASKIAEVFAKNPTIKGVKRVGKCPYATPTDRGVRIIDIFEVEDTKVAEAIREITKWEQPYANAVPEMSYSLEPLLTPEEAFVAIGMQPPK
ncbi:MAG: hypothetical protein WED04_02725 [Promethearchaeati archaeon SRVP18_Atabeyarchaeia-1]